MDYLLLFLFGALNNSEMTDLYINSVEKVYVDKFYSSPVVTLELGSVQKASFIRTALMKAVMRPKKRNNCDVCNIFFSPLIKQDFLKLCSANKS